jgi:hypothetical protein
VRLIDQTEVQMQWADINSRVRRLPGQGSQVRSPGVHLTGVLRFIALQAGILKPFVESTSKSSTVPKGQIQDIDESVMPLRMMLGMFFEDGAVGLYPDMEWQPGEFHKDGVFGTPDGLTLIPHPHPVIKRLTNPIYQLEEFKLTWKSEWNYGKNNFCAANWMWMRQAMGYLKMLQYAGLIILPQCRFHVGWVNGDYRPPSPRYFRYTVEFTQKEIDTLWTLILKHKDNQAIERE